MGGYQPNLKYLRVSETFEQPIDNSDSMYEDLRRCKRQRKKTSFGNDFCTCLVDNDPISFVEAISAPDTKQWDKAIMTEIESIEKNNT